jgi:hypothetical protein
MLGVSMYVKCIYDEGQMSIDARKHPQATRVRNCELELAHLARLHSQVGSIARLHLFLPPGCPTH